MLLRYRSGRLSLQWAYVFRRSSTRSPWSIPSPIRPTTCLTAWKPSPIFQEAESVLNCFVAGSGRRARLGAGSSMSGCGERHRSRAENGPAPLFAEFREPVCAVDPRCHSEASEKRDELACGLGGLPPCDFQRTEALQEIVAGPWCVESQKDFPDTQDVADQVVAQDIGMAICVEEPLALLGDFDTTAVSSKATEDRAPVDLHFGRRVAPTVSLGDLLAQVFVGNATLREANHRANPVGEPSRPTGGRVAPYQDAPPVDGRGRGCRRYGGLPAPGAGQGRWRAARTGPRRRFIGREESGVAGRP